MSTIKVNNITNANGTSAIAIDSSGVATFSKTLVPSSSMMYRNLIINGDMKIAQRGTSLSGQTSSGIYLVDRFCNGGSNHGTWTHSQDNDVPTGQGFTTSLKYACTTADATLTGSDHLTLIQRIEGQNLQHLKFGTANAESLTISFWVKSNKTGTYTNEFYAADGPRHINKEFTIDSADTWEKKTITIDGDTSGVIDNDNGAGLEWVIWLGAGSTFTSGTLQTSWGSANNANRVSPSNVNLADSTSNYINITGVQLEVGDAATPFEHRPYDMELARCQRYYEIGNVLKGITVGNGESDHDVRMTVTKRANPTFTISSQVGVTNNAATSFSNNCVGVNGSGSAYGNYLYNWVAEAEL